MTEPARGGPAKAPRQSWLRRHLMKVFGPPDLGPEHQGNPLRGTKYDPEVKRAERERRRAERRKKHAR
jgi:hypothetical protein